MREAVFSIKCGRFSFHPSAVYYFVGVKYKDKVQELTRSVLRAVNCRMFTLHPSL